jgi:hypothetical protein
MLRCRDVLLTVQSVSFVTLLTVQLAYLASTVLDLGTGNDIKMYLAHIAVKKQETHVQVCGHAPLGT